MMCRKATAKEIPTEQQIFTASWELLKSGYYAKTEEDWRDFVKLADYSYFPYMKTEYEPLCQGLYKVIVDYIESRKEN